MYAAASAQARQRRRWALFSSLPGGTVDRLGGGETGGHGAGRLRTQPRRFVFSGRRAAAREGKLMGGAGKGRMHLHANTKVCLLCCVPS